MKNSLPSKAVSTESGKGGRRVKKKTDINPLNGIVCDPSADSDSISADFSCLGVASTTFESSTNTHTYTSSVEDWFQDGTTSSLQVLNKAETEKNRFAPQELTQSEKLSKLNSPPEQEKKVQVCENFGVISREEGSESTESVTKPVLGSVGDPDILSKLKKEFDKGDEGLMSCLSFLKETVEEQKKVHLKLGSRIKEEDLLFRSLGYKIRKHMAQLYKALQVHKKFQQTSVLQKYKTEDEQKQSTSSTGKIAKQKGSSSRSTKSRAQARLVLKINQLR